MTQVDSGHIAALSEIPDAAAKHYGRSAVVLREIKVDERYQRVSPSDRETRDLAEQWNDKAAGVICLSLRADSWYWCIDGQRRVQALRRLRGEDATIEATVWVDMTPEDEATLFSLLQNRKQLSALDVFKADVFRGDPAALEIQQTVRVAGFEIRASHGEVNEPALNAVGTLRRIHREYGAARLGLILSIWRRADLERNPHSSAIRGLNSFLSRYPEADHNRVIEKLHAAGAIGMDRLAAGQKEASPGIEAGQAWGRALRMRYNMQLKSRQLRDWPDRAGDSERKRLGYEAREERRQALTTPPLSS
jgi:hypothetical protein